MTKPMITIHNCATGEIVEREMSDEELAQWNLNQASAIAKKAEAEAKAAEKAALLNRLGITDAEAKLLLS